MYQEQVRSIIYNKERRISIRGVVTAVACSKIAWTLIPPPETRHAGRWCSPPSIPTLSPRSVAVRCGSHVVSERNPRIQFVDSRPTRPQKTLRASCSRHPAPSHGVDNSNPQFPCSHSLSASHLASYSAVGPTPRKSHWAEDTSEEISANFLIGSILGEILGKNAGSPPPRGPRI